MWCLCWVNQYSDVVQMVICCRCLVWLRLLLCGEAYAMCSDVDDQGGDGC
jgi:hypothetical protein